MAQRIGGGMPVSAALRLREALFVQGVGCPVIALLVHRLGKERGDRMLDTRPLLTAMLPEQSAGLGEPRRRAGVVALPDRDHAAASQRDGDLAPVAQRSPDEQPFVGEAHRGLMIQQAVRHVAPMTRIFARAAVLAGV